MLDNLREGAKGPLGKVIVLVVVMAFGLFGVSTVVPLVFSGGAPVTVNGEEISSQELQQRIVQERQRLIDQLGGQVDPSMITQEMVRPQVIERAIQERLISQAAEEAGFTLSAREIDRILVREPAFQENGQFSSDAFSRIAVRQGMNAQQLRERIGEGAVTSQWLNGVRGTEFILPFEAEQYGALSNQQRSAELARISPANFYAEVEVTQEAIQAYYDNNRDQFATAERVRVSYVELGAEALADQVNVTEADVRAAYDAETASAAQDATKTIAHILISTDERSDEAARERAEMVLSEAQSGEFGALAEEYSDDPGSASQGGLLGQYQANVFPPEFESAVSELSEQGELSGLVQTDFGYHILRLAELETVEQPSFEERAPALREQLEQEAVADQLASVRDQVANLAFSSLDLQPLADEFGLEIQESDWFTRNGGEGIAENPAVVEAAFSPSVLDEGVNSGVIELSDGSLVVLNQNDYEPADTRPLAEVEAQIEERLREQQADAAAGDAAEALFETISGGETGAIAESGYVTESLAGVTRFSEDLEQGLIQALFRAAEPHNGPTPFETRLQGGTRIVGLVTEAVDGELDESERDQTEQFLSQATASATVAALLQDLRASADIEIQ